MRFYLRVDHTMVRIYDTRFYYETGTNFMLREFSRRENKVSELKVWLIDILSMIWLVSASCLFGSLRSLTFLSVVANQI